MNWTLTVCIVLILTASRPSWAEGNANSKKSKRQYQGVFTVEISTVTAWFRVRVPEGSLMALKYRNWLLRATDTN